MPTAPKLLFRPEALRPKVSAFSLTPAVVAARAKLANWAKLLESKRAERMKETELLGDFITDVFGQLLGYTGPASGGLTALKEEHVRSILPLQTLAAEARTLERQVADLVNAATE